MMDSTTRYLCPHCGQMHGVTWDAIVRHCRAVVHVEFDKKARIRRIEYRVIDIAPSTETPAPKKLHQSDPIPAAVLDKVQAQIVSEVKG